MEMNKEYKAHTVLKGIKQQTSIYRVNLALRLGLALITIHLLFDLITFKIFENIQQKIILVLMYPILLMHYALLNAYPDTSFFISMSMAGIINIILIFYTHVLCLENELIWSQLSIVITSLYESYLFSNITSIVAVSVKHTGIWIGAGLYYGKIPLNDPSGVVMSSLAMIFFYFLVMYCDYVKDLEMCKSKLEVDASNEKTFTIVEAISDSIIVLDSELRELFSNTSAKKIISGLSIDNYLSQSRYYRKNYHSDQDIPFISDVKSFYKSGLGNEVNFGVTIHESRMIEWKGKLQEWDEKKALILFGRDITEILILEKEATAGQYKSALLLTVSHELRTPINAILAVTETIKETPRLPESILSNLEIIFCSCACQLYLINDLLDYAQIISGSLKIVKTSFSLCNMLNDCMKIIEIQLKDKKVELKLLYEGIPEKIISDPNRLKQVVLNLLSNAKKFTFEGLICLEVEFTNGMLSIKCYDTGVGISLDKRAILFTQFCKIDSSASMNPQGVGLGLTISNMLVKELGGDRIIVESEVGKGSCFSFSIPVGEGSGLNVEIPEENIQVLIPSIHTKTIMRKINILIVDDSYFNIMAMTKILKNEGFCCFSAQNGYEAIEKIKQQAFACVLMDCDMPIIDGWETTRLIKFMFEKKEISFLPPIIASTAYNCGSVVKLCIDSGMNDVIIKPCAKEMLLDKIRHWVNQYGNCCH